MTGWEWVALALYGVMAGGLLIASVIGWIAWHAEDMCWACYGRGASNDRDGLCHSCWLTYAELHAAEVRRLIEGTQS